MSANPSPQASSRDLWLRAFWFVVATLPATLLTWLGSSLSKDPSDFVREWGLLLPCLVLIGPSFLAIAVDEGVRSFNPSATGTAFAPAMAVSFGASALMFLGIVYLFVD